MLDPFLSRNGKHASQATKKICTLYGEGALLTKLYGSGSLSLVVMIVVILGKNAQRFSLLSSQVITKSRHNIENNPHYPMREVAETLHSSKTYQTQALSEAWAHTSLQCLETTYSK